VIFDHDLSPRQINNIEKATLRKVLDRSELILDIFASRATTAEARLQVELAQLEYTAPRLRAMWNHLERISGGLGSKGPGEMQIEIDRRLVADRKVALQRDLDKIVQRRRREVRARKAAHFTVGIVGYTNAGKSTLFNTMTAGGAYADDRLFATLQTRTRLWDVGEGVRVMLSDTVGFVRDIPHHLVASFRATLEEATHADLLLIVLDIADPAAEMQFESVTTTLDEVMQSVAEEDESWQAPPRVLLLNKADKLENNAALLYWQRKVSDSLAICALPGGDALGHAALRQLVRERARGEVRTFNVTLPMADAKTLTQLEQQAQVLEREYDTQHEQPRVTLRVRVGVKLLARLRSAGARIELADEQGRKIALPQTPPGSDAAQVQTGWGR
jgi:GTP-binding protein HflX